MKIPPEGAKTKKGVHMNMKKILSIALAAVLLVSVLLTLTACGSAYPRIEKSFVDAGFTVVDTSDADGKNYLSFLTTLEEGKISCTIHVLKKGSLLKNNLQFAVIAEYGCTIIPITSDNDRMSDGTILTASESFGATCAEVDGTLGEGYVQAKPCECGKSHISADNQIDASTCAFPDTTWFAKNVRHSEESKYVGELFNLIIYNDSQMTVWDYAEYPQYLINLDDNRLVPLTADNAGEIVPYDETTILGRFKKKTGF
jgi:hypothetical protein